MKTNGGNKLSSAVVVFSRPSLWSFNCSGSFQSHSGIFQTNNQTNVFFCIINVPFIYLFPSLFPPHHSNTFILDQKKREERSILDVAMETEMVVRILELKPDVWCLPLLRRDDKHPEPGHNAVVRNFDYYPACLCLSPACPRHAELCVVMKRGRRETILILSAHQTNFKIT